MIANTQYTDMTGTVAVDISDLTTRSNNLNELATFFKIDQKKFKAVGISVHGTEDFYISFICVDIERSSKNKEHLTEINIESTREDILSLLFKRLHFVLYEKSDAKYRNMKVDDEINISDI